MFKNFSEYFGLSVKELNPINEPYEAFLTEFGGMQFGQGLFNAFNNSNVGKWNTIVKEAFPEFKGMVKLFGYDWLGRCFGVENDTDKETVLMFEIGTNDILEIPTRFSDFLNEEIPQYGEACLAINFYNEWLLNNEAVKYERCISYKVPLFMGGEDVINNLEDSDMEVYWYILTRVKQNIV